MWPSTIQEGYGINNLNCSSLVDELIQCTKDKELYNDIRSANTQSNRPRMMRTPKSMEWLLVASCPRLRHGSIYTKFYKVAVGAIWSLAMANISEYGKTKTKQCGRTSTPALIKAERKRSTPGYLKHVHSLTHLSDGSRYYG
jgi:hypothetical protein